MRLTEWVEFTELIKFCPQSNEVNELSMRMPWRGGWYSLSCCSLQFSCSVMSDSLRPHGLQHARLPCPSPTPGAYSNSCPLSWWCHPNISSVIPFSSCLQSFPATGSFQMSQLFASGGQSSGASASALVLSMNIQGWFLLGCTGWISLQSKGLSRVFSNTTVQKAVSFLYRPLSHPYMTPGKTIALTRQTFVGNVSAFKYAVWFGHNFSSKEQASFNFTVAVTVHSDFAAQENKICLCFHFSPFYLLWSYGTRYHALSFLNTGL